MPLNSIQLQNRGAESIVNQAAPQVEARIAQQRVFESPLVEIGVFRARPDDTDFRNSGPPGRFHVVFPHTSVSIRHEGRSRFVSDINTVTFYNPDDVYYREAVDPRGDQSTWFALAPSLVDELLGELGWPRAKNHGDLRLPYHFGPLKVEDLALQRRLAAHLASHAEVDRLAVEITGMLLFARAIEGSRKAREKYRKRVADVGPRGRNFRRKVLRKTLSFLAEYFDTSVSLNEISREVGCSPFHLCRVFQEEMGVSLHRYRLELRVRRAIDLILYTERTLSDIASEVGFSSHSHLTSTFKRSFGMLPSEVRSGRRMRRQRYRPRNPRRNRD